MVLKIHGYPFAPLVRLVAEDDDGFILYESRAICRYLVKKYQGQGTPGLVPTDPKGEALFEQAASIENNNFYPFAQGITAEKIINKHRGLETNEAKVQELLAHLNAKLDAYETILGRQAYLAGENVTLADLFHLPYGTVVIEVLGCNVLENRPNVARWWQAISSRPAWQEVKVSA